MAGDQARINTSPAQRETVTARLSKPAQDLKAYRQSRATVSAAPVLCRKLSVRLALTAGPLGKAGSNQQEKRHVKHAQIAQLARRTEQKKQRNVDRSGNLRMTLNWPWQKAPTAPHDACDQDHRQGIEALKREHSVIPFAGEHICRVKVVVDLVRQVHLHGPTGIVLEVGPDHAIDRGAGHTQNPDSCHCAGPGTPPAQKRVERRYEEKK